MHAQWRGDQALGHWQKLMGRFVTVELVGLVLLALLSIWLPPTDFWVKFYWCLAADALGATAVTWLLGRACIRSLARKMDYWAARVAERYGREVTYGPTSTWFQLADEVHRLRVIWTRGRERLYLMKIPRVCRLW